MKLIDLEKEFLRLFVDYLLKEVKITPLEDFVIELGNRNDIRFIEGEERKLPRWVAYILSENEKVHIKEDSTKELISKLSTYQAEEASKSLLSDIDNDFYLKMKKLLEEVEETGRKEKIINIFKRMMDHRLPKIAKKTYMVGKSGKISQWEAFLSKLLLELGDEWAETLLKERKNYQEFLFSE